MIDLATKRRRTHNQGTEKGAGMGQWVKVLLLTPGH
jgi:hypothetical protein